MHTTRLSLGALIGVMALAALPAHGQFAATGAPANPPASIRPAILNQIGIDQKLGGQVPLDLKFRDEQGRSVALSEYFKDRPVVISLVYYRCPMLCTMVLNGLERAMRESEYNVGRDYDVITVSFDPSETSALAREKKANYIKHYGREGADKGWHFLTGDLSSIQNLTEAVGFRYKYDPDSRQYAHASGIIVATPTGKLARYLLGVEYKVRDLQFSIMEASSGRIGTKTDQMLLYCYHYDPATGKYGVAVMRLVRLAGGLTVLGIGSFLTLMIRRERMTALARRKEISTTLGDVDSRDGNPA